MTRLLALALLLVAPALASDTDARGWHRGHPAVQAADVLAPRAQMPLLDLPDWLGKEIDRPTVLFYFSPTCPHCQRVAPEIEDLSKALTAQGAQLLGVAVGAASDLDLVPFKAAYHIDFRILRDTRREVGAAIGARSTPSVLLVRPDGKRFQVIDAWYPYLPGSAPLVEGRVTPGGLFGAFAPGEYQGTTVCGSCHLEEARSWALTHHSVAWRTLDKQEATQKQDCIPCHVIGHGAGGWRSDRPDDLVDVGCEACHGPSGPHDGARDDPRAACATCHDPAHSLAFDPVRAVTLIDHFRATDMDDDTWKAARLALVDGQVPRELAALPTGPTAGATACRSCHPTEAATWERDPHAKAMARLSGKQTDDPACLRCHATPRQMDLAPPTTTDAFRADEGVACESCHGPGATHVASAGAPGTIQGLGEDCPVCVVEAICTTCHDATWDPDWEIERALPRVHPGPN